MPRFPDLCTALPAAAPAAAMVWAGAVFCLLGAACPAGGTDLSPPLLPRQPLVAITRASGLGSDRILAGTGARQGGLWIASHSGLDRYHHHRVVHFSAAESDHLPDLRVTGIVEAQENQIWISTLGGIALWDRGVLSSFTVVDGLADNRVLCAVAARDRVWFGTWRGVSLWEGGAVRSFGVSAGLPGSPVTAVHVDDKGVVWLGHAGDGLWSYDGQAFHASEIAGGDRRLSVHTMYEDAAGQLWIGSAGRGLLRREAGSGRLLQEALDGQTVLCMAEDGDGRLWVGSDSGVYARRQGGWDSVALDGGAGFPATALLAHDGGMWVGTRGAGLWHCAASGSCSRQDRLPAQAIHALLADGRGRLWVTSDRGLYRSDGGEWSAVAIGSAGPGSELGALFQDTAGRIWVGSRTGGVVRLEEGRITHLSPDHRFPEGEIHALLETRDGILWLGTAEGLVSYDGEQFAPHRKGLPHPVVYALAESPSGDLWIGTGSGVARRRNGTIAALAGIPEDLTREPIRCLVSDPEGGLWIGTGHGLYRFDAPGRCRWFTTADGLPHDYVRDLALDEDGRLWIATSGGLGRYENGTFTTFTTSDGLTTNLLYSLHVDLKQGVWIGSLAGGVVRFDGRGFRRLTTREGLPSNTIRDIFEDGEGHIWLATDGGLVRYRREDIPSGPGSDIDPRWGLAALAMLALVAIGLYSRRRRRRPGAEPGPPPDHRTSAR